MADLIDRAALLKAIRAEAVNAMELNANRYCESALAFAHCHSMVKKAPAVDAVPVVRCKDCNRNEKNGGDCNRTLTITERDYVLELNVSKYITLDFCSYGERRTDATD